MCTLKYPMHKTTLIKKTIHQAQIHLKILKQCQKRLAYSSGTNTLKKS